MTSWRTRLVRLAGAGLAVCALVRAVPAAAQYPGARPVPAAWRTGFRAITETDARRILSALAGPDFRGRDPFTPDYAAAAGYVVAEMRALGLEPAGDSGSYFQRFNLARVRVIPDSVWLTSADGTLRLSIGRDFSLGAGFDFDYAPDVVFVRLPPGSTAQDVPADRLAGKWVVLSPDSFGAREAVLALLRSGFAFIIVPQDSAGPPATFTVAEGTRDPRTQGHGQPSFSYQGAARLAAACSARAWLAANAAAPTFEPCGQPLRLRGAVTTISLYPTVNVVGRIPGADASWKDEAVVIGAHLDHLGPGPEGIRYGADDNASGVTGALLIARGIVSNPVKPKRSVIIGIWSAEELGTLGSLYYSRHPAVPLERTVAYLNLDMVGRDEDDPRFNERPEDNRTGIYFGSVPLNSADLHRLLQEANAYVGLEEKRDHEDRTERSDTRNFVFHRVPTLKAFTGEHPDYHGPADTPDKINYAKLTNVAIWLYLATEELACRPARPRFERKAFTGP